MNTGIGSLIEQYLQGVHQLVSQTGTDVGRGDLLQLIDRCVVSSEPQTSTHAFFLAEQAFYHGRYKEALKGYLPLSHLPLHLFFCYRASAFLVATLGQRDRALEFAKRALAFQHRDLETLRLCKELGSLEPVTQDSVAVERKELAEIFSEDVREELTTLNQEHNVIDLWTSEAGCYFRWNGLGVVLDPGTQFLSQFHQEGFYLGAVDCIIVTSRQPEHEAGVCAIHAVLRQSDQQIHYYLHSQVYQTLFQSTATAFMHVMERPQDAANSRSIALSDFVSLEYLACGEELAIRFALERRPLEPGALPKVMRVGYLSNLLAAPAASQMSECDLLIIGNFKF